MSSNLKKRLKHIQSDLKNRDLDALIIEDPIMLFYMTGMQFSDGTLLVHRKGAHLLVDGRYFESAQHHSPYPVILKTPSSLKEILAASPYSKSKTLGFDSDKTSYQRYVNLKKATKMKLVGIQALFAKQRIVKDSEEIDALRQAAALGSKGFDFVCSQLREGVTEIEIARALDIFWKQEGSDGLAFDPIIAFGVNSSMPHYRPDDTVLKKNQPVLIDIGVTLHHYHSDMTRVVFFGDPAPKLVEIYNVVKQAQETALAKCGPGVRVCDLDQFAREVIEKAGYGKQFSHGLGHGVGLEIHEAPAVRNCGVGAGVDKDLSLEEGMVLTIEPGIYLPEIGGVRIEDTVVVTKSGCENLTNRSKESAIISRHCSPR